MADRTFYPDLKVEYESRGSLYVAEAEWREEARQWVCESSQWAIRLWPENGRKDGGVDFNGHLFNRQSKRRFRRCRDALVSKARKIVKRTEIFDPDEDLGTPPNDPDISRDHPSNQPKPGYRPADKMSDDVKEIPFPWEEVTPSPWVVREAGPHFNLEAPDRDIPMIAKFYRAGDVGRDEALHNAHMAALVHELWRAVEVLGGSPKGMKEYCQKHNLPIEPPDHTGGKFINLSPKDWWRKTIRGRIRDLAQRVPDK